MGQFRKVLAFRLRGDWGHFKKPFSTSSPLTYVVPPPTALYGLIGAVMGWSRGEYLKRARELGLAFSIYPESYRKVRMSLLWASTKEGDTDYLKLGLMGRLKAGEPELDKARTMISMEVLREPSYVIRVISSDDGFLMSLSEVLRDGRSHFTPYLGISEFIATLRWLELSEMEELTGNDRLRARVMGVVPAELVRDMRTREVLVERVPVIMSEDRVVEAFADVLIHPVGPLEATLDLRAFEELRGFLSLLKDPEGDVYPFMGFVGAREARER